MAGLATSSLLDMTTSKGTGKQMEARKSPSAQTSSRADFSTLVKRTAETNTLSKPPSLPEEANQTATASTATSPSADTPANSLTQAKGISPKDQQTVVPLDTAPQATQAATPDISSTGDSTGRSNKGTSRHATVKKEDSDTPSSTLTATVSAATVAALAMVMAPAAPIQNVSGGSTSSATGASVAVAGITADASVSAAIPMTDKGVEGTSSSPVARMASQSGDATQTPPLPTGTITTSAATPETDKTAGNTSLSPAPSTDTASLADGILQATTPLPTGTIVAATSSDTSAVALSPSSTTDPTLAAVTQGARATMANATATTSSLQGSRKETDSRIGDGRVAATDFTSVNQLLSKDAGTNDLPASTATPGSISSTRQDQAQQTSASQQDLTETVAAGASFFHSATDAMSPDTADASVKTRTIAVEKTESVTARLAANGNKSPMPVETAVTADTHGSDKGEEHGHEPDSGGNPTSSDQFAATPTLPANLSDVVAPESVPLFFEVANSQAATPATSTPANSDMTGATSVAVNRNADGSSTVNLTVALNDDQAPVHITIDQGTDSSSLHIHIGAEALTTLNELQAHRADLMHALEHAGVPTADAQISFGLSDGSGNSFSQQDSFPSGHMEEGAASSTFANTFGGSSGGNDSGGQNGWSPTMSGQLPATASASISGAPSTLPAAALRLSRAGAINITA